MYSYDWDSETGGLLLNSSPLTFSKEPRPVYYKELDVLGFDKYWDYEKNDSYPYMWAEANNYWYRGKHVAKTKGGSIYTKPEIILLEAPEQQGEQLKFIDIPAMVEKNKDLLEKLTSETIKQVYNTFIEYQKMIDVFYVAFSGGKDSVVTLDIVQRALPHNDFKVLFGDTGMEFPDTYDTVDIVEKDCSKMGIEFLRAKSDLTPEESWAKFGPPSQTMRWCCSVHKTTPQILTLRKLTGNSSFRGMAFTGIRADESASRSEYEGISSGDKIKGQYSCHAILEWNTAELFLYIYKNNLVINEAYKKGNSRAGCLVCPLASSKNMYFKEQCYSKSQSEPKNTTTLYNNIILKSTTKTLLTDEAVNEFMNIGGWKARRSGKELLGADNYVLDNLNNGTFTIMLLQETTDWKEWIKTIGEYHILNENKLELVFNKKIYIIKKSISDGLTLITVDSIDNTKQDILFMSCMKTVFRKTAYCVNCKVCQANCPFGYIKMDNGKVTIDSQCIKCRKCHDLPQGCLVADSHRVPKGERKMGSINRYGNMGIERYWVEKYYEKTDGFWDSPHGLGTNMVKALKSFLNDADITQKNKITKFGETIEKIKLTEDRAWALMLCNLAYSSQFNWWIKNITLNKKYIPEEIFSMLDDSMSKNARDHIVSAYRNIFISIQEFGNNIGLGNCDYEIKNSKKKLYSVTRTPWENPDPLVILYSLYKFAESCGDYYQFTLSRLLNHDIESSGVSPTEIFGLDRDAMEKILNGLSINYPEYISASFTLDLDNITLRNDKSANDVLELF